MKNSVYELTCEVRQVTKTRILHAAKGDTGRSLRIFLTDGGQPYVPEAGSYGVLLGEKPDGTVLYNQCVLEQQSIRYDFTDQTCSCPGSFPVQIRIYGPEGKILTTVPISLHVHPTAYDAESAVKSQDEMTALDALVVETRSFYLDLKQLMQSGEIHGKSAYAIAREHGYQGTEEQWLQSLSYDHSEEFTALAGEVRQNHDQVSAAAQQTAVLAEQAKENAATAKKKCETTVLFSDLAEGYVRDAKNQVKEAKAARTGAEAAEDRARKLVGDGTGQFRTLYEETIAGARVNLRSLELGLDQIPELASLSELLIRLTRAGQTGTAVSLTLSGEPGKTWQGPVVPLRAGTSAAAYLTARMGQWQADWQEEAGETYTMRPGRLFPARGPVPDAESFPLSRLVLTWLEGGTGQGDRLEVLGR